MARYIFCGTTYPQKPKPHPVQCPPLEPLGRLAWMPNGSPFSLASLGAWKHGHRTTVTKPNASREPSAQRKNAKDPAHVLAPCRQAKRHRLMLNRTSLPIFLWGSDVRTNSLLCKAWWCKSGRYSSSMVSKIKAKSDVTTANEIGVVTSG